MGFLLIAVLALQQGERQEPPPRPHVEDLERQPQGWDIEFLPDRVIYPPYLADPRQSRTGSKMQFPIGDPKDSSIKMENVIGSYRALALWTDPGRPGEEFELLAEAAVFTRFDTVESWDMDAADYRFGFPLAYRVGDLSFKLHPYHITSHLGDEFISREKRKRDSYHLDEVAFGVSWQVEPDVRVYAEIGVGFYTGPETESGRAQLGADWEGESWNRWLNPFAAIDLQTRNEIGWSWNASAMAGLILRKKPAGTGFRVSVEYYRGHDQQTQFKNQLEHYYAVGFSFQF